MSNFTNSRTNNFLASIPQASLDSPNDDITIRCKFNFSYLDENQEAGQSFSNWNKTEIETLLQKLKQYSRESIEHWTRVPIGKKSGKVLSIYEKFPEKSEFKRPLNIPHQVKWARFRLDYSGRLVGFVIPESHHDKHHEKSEYRFDKNTFYVVFLDKFHKFYIPNDK